MSPRVVFSASADFLAATFMFLFSCFLKIVVSHTAIFKEQEKRNIKAAAKKSAEAEKTTLGDIGGLADLKKQMDAKAKKK